MRTFRGMIALDIDGTITVEKHHLEKRVEEYLNFLIQEGWVLIFVTGRTFSFAEPILASLKGSFYFAVQNGAALYKMPEEKLIEKYYLKTSVLPKIDKIFDKEPGGLLVETGRANKDICYYKPGDFTEKELEYIQFRISISPEKWKAVDSFEEIGHTEFAVGKYFASQKKAHAIKDKIQNLPRHKFNIIVIRDPFRERSYLAHVNSFRASKGKILKNLSLKYPLILAAGDDYNDIEMLEKAMIKIVMENAPKRLYDYADIVAKPAKKQGIIAALKEGIARYGRGD